MFLFYWLASNSVQRTSAFVIVKPIKMLTRKMMVRKRPCSLLNTVVRDSLGASVPSYLVTQSRSCPVEWLGQYLNGICSHHIVQFSTFSLAEFEQHVTAGHSLYDCYCCYHAHSESKSIRVTLGSSNEISTGWRTCRSWFVVVLRYRLLSLNLSTLAKARYHVLTKTVRIRAWTKEVQLVDFSNFNISGQDYLEKTAMCSVRSWYLF